MTKIADVPVRRHLAGRGRVAISPGRLVLWLILLSLVGSPLALLLALALNTGDPQAIPPAEFGLGTFLQLGDRLPWIGNSLWFALWVAVIATAIGLVLAWITARTDLPGKKWFLLLIILPYPMGPMVAAVAWSALGAPDGGVINSVLNALFGTDFTFVNMYTVPGMIVVQALVQAPICFIMIQSALQGMDASLEESSSILGAGRIATAVRVTFPLMLPSIIGSLIFSFVSGLGSFAVPTVLGRGTDFRVATEAVYNLFGSFTPNYPLAAAIGIVLVAISSLLVYAANRFLRRRSYAVIGGKSRAARSVPLGRWRPLAVAIVLAYCVVGVFLPLGVLLVASVQATTRLDVSELTFTMSNYAYVLFEFPTTRQSILNSLVLGVSAGLILMILASAVALAVERSRRAGRSGRALEMLAMAPQAVPRLIFSLALLVLILLLPLRLYGTIWGILLAFIIVFLPVAYRNVAGVVSQVDRSLEEASRVLGASSAVTTLRITAPILRPGIIAAGVLVFMLTLTEVGAALMLSSPHASVLGPTLFSFYDSGGMPLVSALAVIQVAIVCVAVAVIRKTTGKGSIL
jgi:iron(III) transport system permease protein